MRAIQVSEPWGVDRIEVVERPEPAPGHGQVLVRMRAVSLNYRDLLMVGGVYSRGPAMAGTITPFSDGCGVVEAVGEGVTRVKPGDRVSTLFFQNWTSGRATVEKLTSALGSPIPVAPSRAGQRLPAMMFASSFARSWTSEGSLRSVAASSPATMPHTATADASVRPTTSLR